MSSQKDDDEQKVLPIVVIPDSVVFRQSVSQLMVAMQPGVDLPAVEVQEVVVVTDRGPQYTSDDRNEEIYDDDGYDEMHDNAEDELELDYDDGSEAVAAEIEVADAGEVRTIEDFLANGVRSRSERIRVKARKSRYRRKSGHMKKSPVKMMVTRKRVEPSPEYDDSESDEMDDVYGRSPNKPRKRDFAHRLQWRDADMQAAMTAVRDKKCSIRGAAKKFSVPYSTLKDRVRNRVKHGTKPGVKTALSPEDEGELVRCIQQMENAGFQLHGINIREQAHELLNHNCGSNRQRATAPGHNWLAGFLKRHPGIDIKRSVNRPVAPSFSKQKQMRKRFFDALSCAYRRIYDLNGPAQSSQIYTMSEVKLSSLPHTTIIIAASANGAILPPYVLFNATRTLTPGVQQHFPSAHFSVFSSACPRKDIHFSWFHDHFLKHVHSIIGNHPIVLMINQPTSNISVRFVQLAKDRQVSMVCIPQGISHLVQALGDEITRDIDDLVNVRAKEYLDSRKQVSVDQLGIAKILQRVWLDGLPSRDVIVKFREYGLHPLDPNKLTNERMMASVPVCDTSKIEMMSTSSSDNEANGLTLLSELSSLEHGDQSINEANMSIDFKRKRTYSDENNVMTFSPSKQFRLYGDKMKVGRNEFSPLRPAAELVSYGSDSVKMSEELMKQILSNERAEASCSRTRPVQRGGRRHRDTRQELLASRNDPEQLKLAIKNIAEENLKSTYSSQRYLPPSSTPNSHSLRFTSGYGRSPAKPSPSKLFTSDSMNIDVLTAEHNTSKFVTLTPVRHVIELSPNIKQEYISYVEDPLAIQEEFVPQEILEEQTIVQDCVMPGYMECKEEIIEEVIEEVGLPDLVMTTDDTVEEVEVKNQNNDSTYTNNNEPNCDLQTATNGLLQRSLATLSTSGRPMKVIKISVPGPSRAASNPSNAGPCLQINGREFPIFRNVMTVQQFKKELSGATHLEEVALRNECETTDENVLTTGL